MTRLLLLVSIALLPVLAFEIYTEGDARQVRQQLVEDEALRLVRLIASEQQRIADSAEQVLDAISSTPAVQDRRPESCQRILANLLARSPRYNDMAVVGLDGHFLCTPGLADPAISVADRYHFREALRTGGFVIGEYAIGRDSGKPTIHMSKPFIDANGRVVGVVVAALSLDWLGRQLERLALPPEAVAVVIDRNGTILARTPDPQHLVGRPIPEANRFALQGGEAKVVPNLTQNGRERIVGYSPPDAEPKGLLVAVALDRAVSFAAVTQANRTGIVLIVAGGLLALLITALLGGRLIRRPVERLLVVADRWRAGDLTARSGLRVDGSEFGRLGAAFDTMAAALATREHKLSMALESTTDSVVVLDRDWRISFLNGHARAAIGQDRRLLDEVLWEALPGLVDHPIGAALRRAMEQGVPASATGLSPAFGREFEAHAYPSSEGVTVFFRDVTEERRTAAALLENEQHFRAVFEQAAVGMAQVDLQGNFLRINARLAAILDYARDELTSRRFQDITDPADLQGDLAARQTLLDGEVATLSREKRYLRRDGTPVWVNLTISLLRDAEGRPERFISVIEDISARKRIEVALQESETLLRAVLEQIPAAVAVWKRPEGRVALRSRYAETMLGPLPSVWANRSAEHPDGCSYASEDYPGWRALFRGEVIMAEPLLWRLPDGGIIELEVYAAPVRDAAGAILAAVTAAFDMTERNQARRALAQSNAELEARVVEEVAAREAAQVRAAHAERIQALGQLAGGIAHDFNNVLQAVEGAAALIERRPNDAAGIRRLARLVIEAVGRGASVTRRLLAFGRRADLRAEPLDVATMLGGMQEIFAHTLGAAIDVEVRLVDDVPPVLADKGQLETALVNLATNARDAMGEGGRLTLRAEAEIVAAGSFHPVGLGPGRYVRISLADTGTGMDAATLARATEPFFTTKSMGAGTGLGLPMARGFAEQSGGALVVASSPGQGTTVTLYLPAADPAGPDAGVAPPVAEEAPSEAAKPATRVLLVDDEDLLREVLAEQLEDAGYCVLVAANGTEALALLAAGEAVDALVTDLSMPGVDGLAVIRGAQERHPGLPAVLLTGYAGDGAAIAVGGAISGSFSLLRKPIRLHELTDRLQSLLATRHGGPAARRDGYDISL